MVRWSDLTKEEQEQFGNGCGTTRGFLNIPEFIFTASCRQHDFYYSRGGTIINKLQADWGFFVACMHDAFAYSFPRSLGYAFVSVAYYLGITVLPFSYMLFEYGAPKSKEEIFQADILSKL